MWYTRSQQLVTVKTVSDLRKVRPVFEILKQTYKIHAIVIQSFALDHKTKLPVVNFSQTFVKWIFPCQLLRWCSMVPTVYWVKTIPTCSSFVGFYTLSVCVPVACILIKVALSYLLGASPSVGSKPVKLCTLIPYQGHFAQISQTFLNFFS